MKSEVILLSTGTQGGVLPVHPRVYLESARKRTGLRLKQSKYSTQIKAVPSAASQETTETDTVEGGGGGEGGREGEGGVDKSRPPAPSDSS